MVRGGHFQRWRGRLVQQIREQLPQGPVGARGTVILPFGEGGATRPRFLERFWSLYLVGQMGATHTIGYSASCDMIADPRQLAGSKIGQ